MPDLTIIKSGNGTVTSAQAGINCGIDCAEDYLTGTVVTLTAVPDAGWTFSGWSEACSGTGTCDITMNQNALVAASFSAPKWTMQLLDSVGHYGGYTSIATNSFDKAYISYYKEEYFRNFTYYLKYATNSSGSWSYGNTIDYSNQKRGKYTSITIDSNDKLHISYVDEAGQKLKYATNASGSWNSGNIAFALNGYTSIAVDSSGHAHISYYDGSLKYATNASGSWVVTNIASGVGDYSSIALDSNGKAHISYRDGAKLRYATNASGSWVNKIVDNTGGMYTSIGIDSSGHIHITHTDHVSFDLEYATNKDVSPGSGNCYLGSDWNCSVIDGGYGDYTSLSIDSNGSIHVSYYGNGDLKYATNASGLWANEIVDSAGDVGRYSSIAIDSSDKAHISYFDDSNDRIKYAVTNVSVVNQYILNVIKTGTGSGTVTSMSGGIDCGSDCSESYNLTTDVTLTAAPAPGSTFVGWSGGGCSGIGTCIVTMDAFKAVTAAFSMNQYTVTSTADLNGAITPSGSQIINSGNTIAFTITPAPDYHIATIGGTCGGTLSGNTYIVNSITSDCNVNTTFTINTYSVIPPAAIDGTVSPSTVQTVNHGDTAIFTLVPDNGYTLNIGGTCGGTLAGNTYTTASVTADCIVDATFATAFHTVTPSAGGNGTISPSASQTVGYGYSKIFTISADQGYVAIVGGTCGGTLEENTFVTNAIISDCTVDVAFDYNVAPTADEGGPYTGTEGAAITLNASGSSDPNNNIATYEWDIDNNGTYDYSSASSSQSHTYAQQGTYTVKLRVTDALGATSEATTTAVISDTSPTAGFTGNPTSGRAPLTTTFTNSSTGYDTPLTYEWDFDNNGTVDSTLSNPSYEYASIGEYSIKLTATDSDGSVSSLTRTAYISASSCLSPVRITGTVNSYHIYIQSAYDDAGTGDDISFQDDTFSEDLILNVNKAITLIGGYDCDFNATTNKTVINGNVTISDGVVTMENILIQ